MKLDIREADPLGPDALLLLREAAVEARWLYPEQHRPSDPWPTNRPTPTRGAYFIAYAQSGAVAMGAHYPMDGRCSEVRRMFTSASARRQGVGRAILAAVEQHARRQGFSELRLETGNRQGPAIALYEAAGYRRIEPYGAYRDDPTSVCFAKPISTKNLSVNNVH
jgi:GNAT superfamily N-acetyltransferase